MAAKTQGVRTQHPDYQRMLPLWSKTNDAAEGEHKIHEAGTLYLPKLRSETDTDYAARKDRTPFYNATWRTISGLKGMLFRKAPQPDLPAAVQSYLLDIDMAGTPVDIFAQEVSEELLTVGRVGVMVDYPQATTEGMTVAQAAASGLRPMLAKYAAASIINWKVGRINGALQLTLVVLMESADVAGTDEFAQTTETRYRVLDIAEGKYRQRVFRIDDKGNDELLTEVYPAMRGNNLAAIPFVIFNVDSLGARVESPPLLDLVEMNLHHYTTSSDYEHGCHFSGLPTPVITGTNPDDKEKFYVGGDAIICIPDPQATATYMEVQSDFEALRKNLQDKEARMAVLGARMLESQKASVEAADTQQVRVNGEASQLGAMAQILSMGMERVLALFCEWAGASGEVKYQINREFFPVKMTAQELTAIVASWQQGAISEQELFDNLQAGQLVRPETTFEEHQEQIRSRPAGLGEITDISITEETIPPAAPQMDMSAIVAAIANMPAPVVNVAAPIVNIPATVVNIPEQAPANITVNTPEITIQPASITVNNLEGSKTIELQYDADGNVTGGTVNPTGS